MYQPASLKVSSYMALDRHFPDSKNRNLYENVQKCLDNLVSKVEERILGFEPTGMREVEIKFGILFISSTKSVHI